MTSARRRSAAGPLSINLRSRAQYTAAAAAVAVRPRVLGDSDVIAGRDCRR